MAINSLMSTDLVTVDSMEKLSTIKEIFELVSFHHILVLENAKLVGVISDRDYFKSVGPRVGTELETDRDRQPLNKRAHQIMNRRLVTLESGATVLDVVTCFHRNKISCLPVIGHNGEPIGIISWRDVMKALSVSMLKKEVAANSMTEK